MIRNGIYYIKLMPEGALTSFTVCDAYRYTLCIGQAY